LKLAATEHVDVGWPNRHNKGKVVEEDLKDKVLMAVCAALASIVSTLSENFIDPAERGERERREEEKEGSRAGFARGGGREVEEHALWLSF